MLEAGMVRSFMAQVQPEHIEALQAHLAREADAAAEGDRRDRTVLPGDFHVLIAQLMGNNVLAHMLGDLHSRCALITMLYQTDAGASHSQEEHNAIVQAIQNGDEARVLRLMDEHLCHVEAALAPLSPGSPPGCPSHAAPPV
jgi:DNA-binding GntR family transcriptional regulator